MVSTVIIIYGKPYDFQGQPWTQPNPFYLPFIFITYMNLRINGEDSNLLHLSLERTEWWKICSDVPTTGQP